MNHKFQKAVTKNTEIGCDFWGQCTAEMFVLLLGADNKTFFRMILRLEVMLVKPNSPEPLKKYLTFHYTGCLIDLMGSLPSNGILQSLYTWVV